MDHSKLVEQLGNKIKDDFDKMSNTTETNIKSDCVIIKNEFAKSIEQIMKSQIKPFTYSHGKSFSVLSHYLYFSNDDKLLKECNLDIKEYENKIKKLSGQEVRFFLTSDTNKENNHKLHWTTRIS